MLLLLLTEASRNCTSSSFRCPNNGNCIPQVWVCDGDPDCDGGADERDCSALLTRTCPPSQHRCGNGACLPVEWRCDGDPDCSDMSDEMGCQQTGDGSADTVADRECASDEFQCASGHCIKGAYRCDGEIHCRYAFQDHQLKLALRLFASQQVSYFSFNKNKKRKYRIVSCRNPNSGRTPLSPTFISLCVAVSIAIRLYYRRRGSNPIGAQVVIVKSNSKIGRGARVVDSGLSSRLESFERIVFD